MPRKQASSLVSEKIVTPPTKQQAAYSYLKNRIMRMEIKPGERVIIDDVADVLGLSAIPVREALQFLQSEGLVYIRPHAGATVSMITASDVEETFTILEGVEAMAVRYACVRCSDSCLAELARLLKQMDEALKRQNVEAWSKLNMDFHLALARATGMSRLVEITRRALDDWDRIRRYFFSDGVAHRIGDAQKEHHHLFLAIQKDDAARAEKIVRLHNRKALSHYLKIIHEQKMKETISPHSA